MLANKDSSCSSLYVGLQLTVRIHLTISKKVDIFLDGQNSNGGKERGSTN